MENIAVILFLLSILGLSVGTILLVISLVFKVIKKKSKLKPKKVLISIGILFVIFITSIIIMPQSDTTNNNVELEVQSDIKKDEIEESTENKKIEEEPSTETSSSDVNKEIATTVDTNLDSEIHFINTGNSDSILIKQEDKAVLIDGGDNNDGNLVSSYLKNQGIKTIEYMIATHPDADHIGGLDEVINNFTVNNLLVANGDADTNTYRDFINAAANKGISPSVPLNGAKFNFDSATLEVLSCANVTDTNNRSIVVLYTNGKDKILFMGDAETEVTNGINPGDVDLIKISHHGSANGTSNALLQKSTPEYAVITVGANNKYGHPDQETMSSLQTLNIPAYRTDEGGNIIFKSTGNGVTTTNTPNSYNAGAKIETTSNTENTNSSSNNTNSTPVTEEKPTTESNENKAETVYWVPKGTVYHSTKSCPTLSRSKTILEGTIKESGKSKHCSKC